MVSATEAAARILEIETLQDDVLSKLEALERRVEEVLAEYLGPKRDDSPPTLAQPSV
jgi:hypothetical protein